MTHRTRRFDMGAIVATTEKSNDPKHPRRGGAARTTLQGWRKDRQHTHNLRTRRQSTPNSLQPLSSSKKSFMRGDTLCINTRQMMKKGRSREKESGLASTSCTPLSVSSPLFCFCSDVLMVQSCWIWLVWIIWQLVWTSTWQLGWKVGSTLRCRVVLPEVRHLKLVESYRLQTLCECRERRRGYPAVVQREVGIIVGSAMRVVPHLRKEVSTIARCIESVIPRVVVTKQSAKSYPGTTPPGETICQRQKWENRKKLIELFWDETTDNASGLILKPLLGETHAGETSCNTKSPLVKTDPGGGPSCQREKTRALQGRRAPTHFPKNTS